MFHNTIIACVLPKFSVSEESLRSASESPIISTSADVCGTFGSLIPEAGDQHIALLMYKPCIFQVPYCKSLFFGLHDSQLDSKLGKLHRVQNACAGLVCNSPRFSRCTPLLC